MRKTSMDPPCASRRPEVRRLAAALRARFLLLLPLCVVVLAFAWTADADAPYPTVTMTEAGPASHLDFNTSFYLSGEVDKDTDRVQAMVVRKGNPVIGGGVGPPCYQVRQDLQGLMSNPRDPGIQTVTGASSGSHTILVTAAWTPPPAAKPAAGADDAGAPKTGGVTATITANINIIGDMATTTPDGGAGDASAADAGAPDGHPVVVVTNGPAAPADTPKPVTFKLFVPRSDEFFRPGMSFCLLVFQHKKPMTDSIAPLVAAYVRDQQVCEQRDAQQMTDELGMRGTRSLSLVCKSPSPHDVFKAKLRELVYERQRRGGASQPAEEAAVNSAVVALETDYDKIKNFTKRATKVRDGLHDLKRQILVDPAKLDLEDKIATTALLGLLKLKDGSNKADVGEVAEAKFVAREYVRVTRKRVPKDTGNPEIVGTNALLLPNSTITVRDLMELGQGQLRLDNSYFEPAQVYAELEPVLISTAAYSPQDRAILHAVRDQLRALKEVVTRLRATQDSKGSKGLIEVDLAKWLTPALHPDAGTALNNLADELAHLEAQHDNFLSSVATRVTVVTDAIDRSMSETTPASVPVAADRQFDQNLWASAYLTPVVGGVVVLPPHSDAIIAPYSAVQLHLWPNLIDDPMWIRGVYDMRRFFALELGVATNSGPFGTDSRFHGLTSFPPVFGGLAIHPIPYTSLTGGISFFDVRSSTVTQQSYQVTALPFLAVNVQANIPNLVRVIAHRNNVTTNVATGEN